MPVVFRAFPSDGVVAIFEEASGGGDMLDITSDRNRPANDPENWLANILFHSDLNYLEVAAEGSVSHSHSAASAASFSGYGTDADAAVAAAYGWGSTYEDFAIVTHNLGYVPYAAVIFDGKVLHPGIPVQTGTGGAVRYATAYCTTTQVRVETWCSVGTSAMSSTSITYEAIVFRDPRAASGAKLIDIDDATGVVRVGLDKFGNDRKYAQAVDGGSEFDMLNGRGGDVNNGAPRFSDGDGGVTDTVPSTTKMAITSTYSSTIYGSAMVYGGSYSSPSSFQLQVPDDPPGGDSGLIFDPVTKVLKFIYGGRETLTNSGKLVSLLDEQTLSHNVSFLTFSTNTNYSWMYYYIRLNVLPEDWLYNYEIGGQAWVAVPTQSSESTTNLATVPTGADFVCGLMKLTRTNAPDNWTAGDPIEILPKDSVWIPFMGSTTALLEAGLGMSRMISVYVDGGYLKLWQKQSVSNPPGGFSNWTQSGSVGGYPWVRYTEHYANGSAGIPVRMSASGPSYKFTSGGPVYAPPPLDLYKWNGADPPTPPAIPDFASAYTIDLQYSFGCRS
jgi:hypothetical protein